MIQGVITGDIVDSSKLSIEERERLLLVLNEAISDIKTNICEDISYEVFRGDSFQIVVDNPAVSLSVAVILRASLMAHTPVNSSFKWDARIAVGIGTIDFKSDHISTSDGEAFKNSGRCFDKLKKNERLAIQTPWNDFSRELEVSTGFADHLITKWTQKQAEAILPELLTNSSQKEIAGLLNKTVQNVSNVLNSAKLPLIKRYLNRFRTKIEEYGSK